MSNLERDSTLRDNPVDADENVELITSDLHETADTNTDPLPLPSISTIETCSTSTFASTASTFTPGTVTNQGVSRFFHLKDPQTRTNNILSSTPFFPTIPKEDIEEVLQPLPIQLDLERDVEREFDEFLNVHTNNENKPQTKAVFEVIDLESQSQSPHISFIQEIKNVLTRQLSADDVQIIETEPISSKPSTTIQNEPLNLTTIQKLETDTLPILTNSDLNIFLQDNRKDKPTFQFQQQQADPDIIEIQQRPPVIIQQNIINCQLIQPPSIQQRKETLEAQFERDLIKSSLEFREFESIRRNQSASLIQNTDTANSITSANLVTDTSTKYNLNLNLNLNNSDKSLDENYKERENNSLLSSLENLFNMDKRRKAFINFENALAERRSDSISTLPIQPAGVQPGPSTSSGNGPMQQQQNNVQADNSNNDCVHFFKPFGCLMGDDCSFRHSEAAMGCYTECDQWKFTNGQCEDWVLCPRRHMKQEDIINHKRKYYDARPEAEVTSSSKKAKPAEATATKSTATYIPPRPTGPLFSTILPPNPIISTTVTTNSTNVSNPIHQYNAQQTKSIMTQPKVDLFNIQLATQKAISAATEARLKAIKASGITPVLVGVQNQKPTPAQKPPRASKTNKIIIPSKYKDQILAPIPSIILNKIPNPLQYQKNQLFSTTASSTVTSAASTSTSGILPPQTATAALPMSTPSLSSIPIPNSELVVPSLSASTNAPPAAAVVNNNKGTDNPSNKSLECPICLEDFESIKAKNFTLMFIQCGHIVCSDCCVAITKLKPLKANSCPVCRKPITQKPKPCFF